MPFISRNVVEDATAWAELALFGLRRVPIVTRGMEWANGQVLRDVARIAGIVLGAQQILPPAELARRVDTILTAEQRFFGQMPEEKMQGQVPGRPRSFANLAWHTFNVIDAWLELVVDGKPLDEKAYSRNAPLGKESKADILAYGMDVQRRFNAWWEAEGEHLDYEDAAAVYYGDQTLHEFLERSTWHAGQHVRQMMMILETFIGIAPEAPLGPEMWQGLPMPEKVWDEERAAG